MQDIPHRDMDRQWLLILGIAVGLMVAIVGSFSILIEGGLSPSADVVEMAEISDAQIGYLVESDILDPDESVFMFYSAGLISIEEAGNLLTDDRLISYVSSDDWQIVRSVTYDQIASVTVLERGNDSRPTIVDIHTQDGQHIHIALAATGRGDERFIDEIRRLAPAGSSDTIVELHPRRR
ncbi:MAG: hypothetical protein Kow0074_05950 [Candidatus Zixiibacteriota bacterium]